MEYILYYNHQETGYGFYERSAGFPTEYQQALQEVCNRVTEPKSSVGNVVALRYGPLQDRYLLSVIFRQPDGDGLQVRGVNTLVNYLLTEQEADAMFSEPPAKVLYSMERAAREQLRADMVRVNTVEQQPITAKEHLIPMAQLFNAASYAGAASLSKQAYFVMETPILPEVAAMLELLPKKLRKYVSFHTGIQSTRESIDVAVSFGTRQMMEDTIRSGMSGGQSSTAKYLYHFYLDGDCQSKAADVEGIRNANRMAKVLNQLPCKELAQPLLLDPISTWQQLQALVALDSPNPMLAVLELIPTEQLLQFLQTQQVSDDTLQNIFAAAQGKRFKEVKKVVQQIQQEREAARQPVKKPLEREQKKPIATDYFDKPEKKKREAAPMSPKVRWLLGAVIKLAITAGLAIGVVQLVKGIVQVDTITQETVTQLVISVTEVKKLFKILCLTGFAAALSSWITYHIMKWKSKKNTKKSEEILEK